MLIRGSARDFRRQDGAKSLEQRALSIIRLLGGDVIHVQSGFPRMWTDSAVPTPVTAVGDMIGRVVGRTGLITATQATTASKPLVAATSGRLAMSFDGSGDFLQTVVATGNEMWLCAGINFADTNSTIFVSGAGSASQRGIWMYRTASDDRLNFMVGNGAATTNASASAAQVTAGIPCVVEACLNASTQQVGVNGQYGSLTARTGNASPAPSALRIGAYTDGVTYPLSGSASAFIYTPVLPSLSQRQLIRRWVASLQG